MTLLNTQHGYGALTKLFHWLIVALFAFQYSAANVMLRMDTEGTVLGLNQDIYYNWHKSIPRCPRYCRASIAGAQGRATSRLGS